MTPTKHTCMRHPVPSVAVAVCLSLVHLAQADATVLQVPSPHATIQAAIDLAAPADTVLVDPGVYTENIDFLDKNIVVGSRFLLTADSTFVAQTVIAGGQQGSVVRITGGQNQTAALVGCTLMDGRATRGGGIWCDNASPTLSWLIVRDNEAFRPPSAPSPIPIMMHLSTVDTTGVGGGIYIHNGTPRLLHVRLEDNVAAEYGGGIAVVEAEPPMEEILIRGNAGTYGAGLYCHKASPVITNVTAVGNRGTGVHCEEGSSPQVTHAVINRNTGRGIALLDNSNPTLRHVEVRRNEGGGIMCFWSSPVLTDVVVADHSPWGSGSGTGGIDCSNSNPILERVVLRGNDGVYGGGIHARDSSPVLTDCEIIGNTASNGGGGASFWWESRPVLTRVTMVNNSEDYWGGGGLHLTRGASAVLRQVTIAHNTAVHGGGISVGTESTVEFDPDLPSRIYLNAAAVGNDLHVREPENLPGGTIPVYLDTFTVQSPAASHAFPLDAFDFVVGAGLVVPIEADLYVDPDGTDENSGTSPADPLRTIRRALSIVAADSLNPRTVHLARGRYSAETNGEPFPVYASDYVTLSGAGAGQTVLDGGGTRTVVRSLDVAGAGFERLTLANGGGPHRAALDIMAGSDLRVRRVAVVDSRDAGFHIGIEIGGSSPVLSNLTVSGHAGWAIIVGNGAHPVLLNSVLWDNDRQIHVNNAGALTIAFSDVAGGPSAVEAQVDTVIVEWEEGNIDADPLFVDADAGDYRLAAGSPAVDRGTATFVVDGTEVLDLGPDDYAGLAPDLGAFEHPGPTAVTAPPAAGPRQSRLHQNHPNPFNAGTRIAYAVAEAGSVKLEVYDALGRPVATLVSGRREAGPHAVLWDGTVSEGVRAAAGVYFSRLSTARGVQVRRMELVP